MFDYVRGLSILKKCVSGADLQTYYTLEARLLENLQNEDLYGVNPAATSDKNSIIGSLNKLALRYSEQSFNDMCLDLPVKSTSASGPQKDLSLQTQPPVQSLSLIPAKTKVDLLAPVVPTAYCQNLDVDAFPLLKVTIDTTNPQCGDTVLQIYTRIEDYSDEQIKRVSLPHGNLKEVLLFPLFKHDVIKNLNETRFVTLRIRIKQVQPVADEYETTERLRLLSYDTALLALEMKDETVVDLSC